MEIHNIGQYTIHDLLQMVAMDNTEISMTKEIAAHLLKLPVAVPPMPATKGRDAHGVGDYLESDVDWASSNQEAVTWLADNHEAIRAALNYEAPPVTAPLNGDRLKNMVKEALGLGLSQAEVLELLHNYGDQYPAYAAAVDVDDELEVDDKPLYSQSADGGVWVSAWVWVSDAAAGVEPDADADADAEEKEE